MLRQLYDSHLLKYMYIYTHTDLGMTNAIYDKHHILLRIDYLGQTYYSTLSKIIFFLQKNK